MFKLGMAGVLFGTLISTGSFAADLALTKAPALAYYDWTGFYVGGNGGYGVSRDQTASSVVRTFNNNPISTESFTMAPAGWVGGVQAGYNRQVGRAVLGFEADWQWTGQRDQACVFGCQDQIDFQGPNKLTEEHKLDWFATARARAGYAGDHWLWYVTAGAAYARVQTNGVFSLGLGTVNAPNFPTTVASTNASFDRVGLAAGAGIETALSGSWTAKIEYLYLDLGTVNGTTLTVDPNGGPRAGLAVNRSVDLHDHIIRVGLNYRVGGGEVAAASGGYFKAPRAIAAQDYNWTGVYVGANGGYGVAKDSSVANIFSIANIGPPVLNKESFTQASGGGLVGGQVGFNYQVSHIVFGLEADAQWANQLDRSCLDRCTNTGGNLHATQQLKAFATARARLGYAANAWLWYVTAGGAWGDVASIYTYDDFGSFSLNQGKYGWVAGGGVETALGGNWTAKFEYLYMDLGSANGQADFVVNPNFVNGPIVERVVGATTFRDNIFRAGVNYKFGGPDAVVARY